MGKSYTSIHQREELMLGSIDNSPLVYPTVEENGQTRPMKYFELTEAQQLHNDCDVQATNIMLHGLPPDVYALVNYQEVAKAIWDKVKLIIKGTKLSYQEREWRLYDLFHKFAFVEGETFKDRIRLITLTKHWNLCLMWHQGDDPIDCINKALAFMSDVASRGNATNLRGTNVAGQPQVMKCYNCQGERHIARQCTQPKRPRNAAWFNEKLMLAEAQEAGQILDKEQLAFLADSGMDEAPDTNSSAPNDLLILSLVEQMTDQVANFDKENQINKMVNESLFDELERYKERVVIFEQRVNADLNNHEKLIDSQMDDLIWTRNAKLAAFQ
nr:hypothetical protein [Tanacetum cinerariifolium]